MTPEQLNLIEKLITSHNSLVQEMIVKNYAFKQQNAGVIDFFIGKDAEVIPMEVAEYTKDFLAGVKEIVEAMNHAECPLLHEQ